MSVAKLVASLRKAPSLRLEVKGTSGDSGYHVMVQRVANPPAPTSASRRRR